MEGRVVFLSPTDVDVVAYTVAVSREVMARRGRLDGCARREGDPLLTAARARKGFTASFMRDVNLDGVPPEVERAPGTGSALGVVPQSRAIERGDTEAGREMKAPPVYPLNVRQELWRRVWRILLTPRPEDDEYEPRRSA